MHDDDVVEQLIVTWFDRARIDYAERYVHLYIAYNAWFRRVTKSTFDRDGIARLKKRFGIWADYLEGNTLQELRPVVERIAAYTVAHPLLNTKGKWDGIVHDSGDWQGLISFWYHIRCDLFHGELIDVESPLIQWAYESLYIFMHEIICRMKTVFKEADMKRLYELYALSKTDVAYKKELEGVRRELENRYVRSAGLWSVDMTRVKR